MAFRILSLEECVHHDGRKLWLELMEMNEIIPVCFYAEHVPFLKYDAQDRVMMIDVRADQYGKTWRCWNSKPPVTDWQPVKK